MLAEFITRSGENQAAWAKRLCVSRSYLSGLVNGNKSPSLDLAVRIERLSGGEVPATSWVPQTKEDAA